MNIVDKDRAAIELYVPARHHAPPCNGPLSLFDGLTGVCPHCGKPIVAGPDITPEMAAEMLSELQARRVELGLRSP